MPNHCETDLIISGPAAKLQECVDKYFTPNGELDCNAVIPYPQRFKDMDDAAYKYDKEHPMDSRHNRPKDGFNSGGYEWCVQNWGTKWGTYDGRGIGRTARSVKVSFQSAWSPPVEVMDVLARKFRELTFTARCYECGMAYKVHIVWKKGVKVKYVESKYHGSRGG